MLLHSLQQVAMPRPPITQATTCRVCLQTASQTQHLLPLLRTNDHSSSSSSWTASGLSGVTRVALRGGVVSAFFKPFRHRSTGHPEGSGQPTHAGALLVRLQYLVFLRFAVTFGARVLSTGLAARSTQVLLFPIGRTAVLDKAIAFAVLTVNNLSDHPLAYQSLMAHYPNSKGHETSANFQSPAVSADASSARNS